MCIRDSPQTVRVFLNPDDADSNVESGKCSTSHPDTLCTEVKLATSTTDPAQLVAEVLPLNIHKFFLGVFPTSFLPNGCDQIAVALGVPESSISISGDVHSCKDGSGNCVVVCFTTQSISVPNGNSTSTTTAGTRAQRK